MTCQDREQAESISVPAAPRIPVGLSCEERAHGQSCWLLQELPTMTSQLLCFQ